ncbi:hypothetical protein FD754_020152 [Muntiacus muntjak]|uniref:Immunoglobulin V-set domain-containing protein n=1 Tax=Muntiacus muntjak TaxID=9888 RepID=A0A5N3V253_MUNMU|nr:hypothetical protein FD754_020152 [Muntiacus muntjak]
MTLMFTLMLEILLFLTGAGAQSVTQPDDHITCNYSSSVSPYLFWSVQYPDQGPQLLLKYMSGDNLVSGIKGFEAELRKSEKSFHLRKIPAHWKDSAKYFCALSDTVPGAAGGAEHKPPGHSILSGSGCQVLLQNRVGEGEETN